MTYRDARQRRNADTLAGVSFRRTTMMTGAALPDVAQPNDAQAAFGLATGSGLTLSLVLTHHWYDLTESGAKLTEYRAFTPRWKRLIWDRRNRITHVRFSRGYTRRTMTFRVDHIFIGCCPLEGWTGTFYCIRFHPNTGDEARRQKTNSP